MWRLRIFSSRGWKGFLIGAQVLEEVVSEEEESVGLLEAMKGVSRFSVDLDKLIKTYQPIEQLQEVAV